MNHSTPGLPVHHQLPEFTQTSVHWVGGAIQPSHPLSSPFPPALNLSQHQGLFKWVSSLHQVAKVLEFQLQYQSFPFLNVCESSASQMPVTSKSYLSALSSLRALLILLITQKRKPPGEQPPWTTPSAKSREINCPSFPHTVPIQPFRSHGQGNPQSSLLRWLSSLPGSLAPRSSPVGSSRLHSVSLQSQWHLFFLVELFH